MSRSTKGEIDPDPGSNTLVLAPPDELESESLIDCYRSSSSRAAAPVLIVTASWSPTEILDEWRTHTTELPSTLAIVSLDDLHGLSSRRSTTSTIDGVSVTSVPVSDLTLVANSIDEYLTGWCNESVPLLWFDSITTLVQTASLETSFRFLHLLTKQVQATGVIAYYQLDPTASGRATVSSLTPLFDYILE